LVCDGLDTLATVILNGRPLGHANNMFRQYCWEIKSQLQAAENELTISFSSPVNFTAEKQGERPLPGVSQAIPGGPYLRKAPCQFGWDWGPQLAPIGIWKDIRLEGASKARLTDVYLRQNHGDQGITVSAELSLEQWTQEALTARLHITAPDGGEMVCEDPVSPGCPTLLNLTIPQPQLWWPNGYGDQPLYQVNVSLHQHDRLLDQRQYQLGLRTIELRQNDDQWGRSFEFVVNGVPIFAKGSNWIPADSFPTRITDDYLEALIRDAAKTHQNMLRVWGGGFYEEERFYDLCDRYGILVWQDFVFSCSVYPLNDPDFLENVRVEIAENVRRLRHRASLALWCGNNEMEWGWAEWGWTRPDLEDMKAAYDRFFHHTLVEWCAAGDPDTVYWPSSPSSDVPFDDPNGQQQGDAHFWGVWHGRLPFTAYRSQYPRFMSEFGFQALPPLDSIRTYAEEADWNMTSYIMEQHQKNDSGNSLMVGQMLDTFRLPTDFPSLVYLSMVLQAEGIRYGVEHWRRSRDRVAGTLYWQLNDCWPVASWSSLDYFGRWKALHYAARRFYASLLLSIEDDPPHQGVYITSDRREKWDGCLKWSLEALDGQVLAAGEEPVLVAPLSTTHVKTFDFSDYITGDAYPADHAHPADRVRELLFLAELWQENDLIARQAAFFAPTKHLQLADPALHAVCRLENNLLHIDVSACSLARLVEIALDGADVVFSDNYFDLPAGRTITVTCSLPSGWSVSQAQAALRLRSVYESFAN
jgi:beta-mannosidase